MRIVSIATHMPYVGIPHAGGQYYLRHAEILAERHDLTVVCPWTPANAEALDQSGPGFLPEGPRRAANASWPAAPGRAEVAVVPCAALRHDGFVPPRRPGRRATGRPAARGGPDRAPVVRRHRPRPPDPPPGTRNAAHGRLPRRRLAGLPAAPDDRRRAPGPPAARRAPAHAVRSAGMARDTGPGHRRRLQRQGRRAARAQTRSRPRQGRPPPAGRCGDARVAAERAAARCGGPLRRCPVAAGERGRRALAAPRGVADRPACRPGRPSRAGGRGTDGAAAAARSRSPTRWS